MPKYISEPKKWALHGNKQQDLAKNDRRELVSLAQELLNQDFRPSAEAIGRLAAILLRQSDEIHALKSQFQDMEKIHAIAFESPDMPKKSDKKKAKLKKRKLAKIPGQKKDQSKSSKSGNKKQKKSKKKG